VRFFVFCLRTPFYSYIPLFVSTFGYPSSYFGCCRTHRDAMYRATVANEIPREIAQGHQFQRERMLSSLASACQASRASPETQFLRTTPVSTFRGGGNVSGADWPTTSCRIARPGHRCIRRRLRAMARAGQTMAAGLRRPPTGGSVPQVAMAAGVFVEDVDSDVESVDGERDIQTAYSPRRTV
jgi:hypothetical protein